MARDLKEGRKRAGRVRNCALKAYCVTYIVQVGLHVDQSESLFEKDYQHAAGDPVLIKAVFVHVRLLRKHERGVFKAYTDA